MTGGTGRKRLGRVTASSRTGQKSRWGKSKERPAARTPPLELYRKVVSTER